MTGLAFADPGWGALLSRRYRHGYDALTPDERVWFNVGVLIGDIGNGGLISHFYNSGADTLPDCLAGLERIGAHAVRLCVVRIAVLFPGGVPPTLEERNEVIVGWADGGAEEMICAQVEKEVMPLLDDLEAVLDEFLRAAGLPSEVPQAEP